MKCVCLNSAAVGQDDHRGEDLKLYETFGAKIHAFLKAVDLHFFSIPTACIKSLFQHASWGLLKIKKKYMKNVEKKSNIKILRRVDWIIKSQESCEM